MSETDTYTQDFNEAFKERLRVLPYLIVLFVIAYWANKGLWGPDKVVLLSVLIALMPIKLFLILFRFGQLWHLENKKVLLFLFLPLVLVFAFIFDIETVPNLWVYRLGTETKGNAIEFIATSKTHFMVYEFSVDNVIFQKQQKVSIPYYESLKPGAVVTVKYAPNNPRISYLMDMEYLKRETMFALFAGFGVIVAVFANEIQEKANSFIRSLHFRKTA